MIDLQFLASKINEIIGYDKYFVYLNTNVFPCDIGNRTVVTMNVVRVPFAFTLKELDAENMTITLTFDLPVAAYGEELTTRDLALSDIQTKLLGWQEFKVEQPTENYIVTAKFEQQPTGNPYPDSGRKTQQIVVSGVAQVQSEDCALLIGNNVAISIDGTRLLKLSKVSTVQIGADNNLLLSEFKTIPDMQAISRANTKTLTFLYTGQPIEDEFLQIAEGVTSDINRIFLYKAEYPNFTVSQHVKILSVSTQDSAGVYLQYTLTMQVVETEEAEQTPGIDGDPDSGDSGNTDTGEDGDADTGGDSDTGSDTNTGGNTDAGGGTDTGGGDADTGDDTVTNVAEFGYEDLTAVVNEDTTATVTSVTSVTFAFSQGESSRSSPSVRTNTITYYNGQILTFTSEDAYPIERVEFLLKGDYTASGIPISCNEGTFEIISFDGTNTTIVWTASDGMNNISFTVSYTSVEVVSITVTTANSESGDPT